jgi:hypothetical protein
MRYATQRGTTQNHLLLSEFTTIVENILGHESETKIGLFYGKKPEVQNLVTLFLSRLLV